MHRNGMNTDVRGEQCGIFFHNCAGIKLPHMDKANQMWMLHSAWKPEHSAWATVIFSFFEQQCVQPTK